MQSMTFQEKYKKHQNNFIRQRKLTFLRTILLILMKSSKSLQQMVNEFFNELGELSVTKQSFSKARRNLKYEAFQELNQKAVVEVCYQGNNYQTWQGFRVLAIDGSKIRLPNTPEITEHFGQISYANQRHEVTGSHTYSQASVLYDLYNRIAIHAHLAVARAYEVDLAIEQHLPKLPDDSLLVADRAYADYRFLAQLIDNKSALVIRCGANSFLAVRKMLAGFGDDSQLVTIKAPSNQVKRIQSLRLPSQIRLRLVRFLLSTGEFEVLATSLFNEQHYWVPLLAEIYHRRWGIETFFSLLKTRLQLENFTGKTLESVQQDFYSTIYISGLESILTADTNKYLANKPTLHQYQVNKMVSFNAIKDRALELFYLESDMDQLLKELSLLFLLNPSCSRPHRFVPRKKLSYRPLLHFHKRLKKIAF